MMLAADGAVMTWQHMEIFFAGSTALGLIAHAVNTFPTPANPYGQWLLGIIKFAVGQRQSAMNAMRGSDSVTVPVPQGTGSGLAKSSHVTQQHTDVTPESITVATEKVIKTETVVPNPVGPAHALPPQVPDK
jgi:hypothetical protein